MSLDLIIGLPNTGRTEELREEFEKAAKAGRDPILLVPSVDDVFSWEDRLTRAGDTDLSGESAAEKQAGGFAGGRIMHFNDLCREIVRKADGREPRLPGEMRRRLALERAVERVTGGDDGLAAKIEGKTGIQPGLLDAALELVDEYRAERIERGDPFGTDSQTDGPPAGALDALRRGIEPLVREYERDLASDGLADAPRIADRALEVIVDQVRGDRSWDDRPLFVAGFDDLTGQQLELLRKLSNDAGVSILMAITWKKGLGRGFLTDRLMIRLTERLDIPVPGDPPDRTRSSGPLAALAEAFIAGGRDRGLAENPPLTVIQAAGERKEAEVIGAEIARLLSSGNVLPGEIAVAHTDPASSGRLLDGVLRRYGIPTALETETGALSTCVGASLAALLRAAEADGTAADLILWLRGPLGPTPETVDEIERKCRRRGIGTASGALALVPEEASDEWTSLFGDERLRSNEMLALIGELARKAGHRILRDATPREGGSTRPDPEVELEVRMAETLADSARDLASADTGGKAGPGLLLESIRRGEISVWTVPTKGCVRITGLWALRSKRVKYLFVAGLQETGTRDLSRAGPFLSTAERRGLEMLERVDPEIQARYLLFSCLNVPTEALWLSCTTSDDSGESRAPSPLLAEIVALCPEPLPLIERSGSDITFPPVSAPTVAELVRSLVVEGADPESLGLAQDLTRELQETIKRARSLNERARVFGQFEEPSVRAALAATESFSPSEIEAWLACPWSWLIDRRIRPKAFSPDPSYLVGGNFAHEVLERLYRETSGGKPDPDNIDDWLARVPAVCDAILADDSDHPLTGDEPAVRLARFTLEKTIGDFLRREAELASPYFSPVLFEQRFFRPEPGEDPVPDALDEVDMGSWRLKGTIDRVDTRAGTEPAEGVGALVIDYKTGSTGADYSPAKLEKYGKLQIPLYMEAIRRSMGLDPVAGFVLSLRAGQDVRGPVPADDPGVVGKRSCTSSNLKPSIDDFLSAALSLADGAVSAIRKGELEHRPGDCRKHFEDRDGLLPEASALQAPEIEVEQVPVSDSILERPGETKSPPFTSEQEAVIRSRSAEIMVSAAAGSGKTAVTVERYRKLLEGESGWPPLEPDQILVFTFTDKAASKLREEVRETRSREAGEPVSMSDAWVGTFHSICSRILTAYPLEAGIDPGYTVIDDITSATLRDQAFDRALGRRLEGADGELDERMAVLSGVKQVTLKKALFGIFDRLRARGMEFPVLELPSRPTYPARSLEGLSEDIGKALPRTDIRGFKDGGNDHKGKLRELKTLIDEERDSPLTSAEVAACSFSNKALEEETGILSLRLEVETKLLEYESFPWLAEFGHLLEAFGEEYGKLKAGRSALDYEDLQIKTLNLLLDNPMIQAEYASRFEEVMVDEFQDTNQLQMKLIEALRGGGTTRLMTVGDEMQAIYGFRHADVGIFRERCQMLDGARGCELIELPRNYRSDPAVIEAVNAIGATIHDQYSKGGGGRPSFTPLVAGKDEPDSPDPTTTVLLTPEKGWDEVDLGPLCSDDQSGSARATAAEALSLASHIRGLVDSGEYSQSDVAILLRSTTRLSVFQEALTLSGLRSVVSSSKGFWSSRPVRQIIALIAVVANPFDDEALTATLTSPACGLGPDGLWKVRESAGNGPLWKGVVTLSAGRDASKVPGKGPDGDLVAVAALHQAISEARDGLDRTSLESLVSGLLDSTGLVLANLVRDRTSLATMERIATLAGEYEAQEGRDLRGFLDWATSSREADAEAAISVSSEQDDAIKIMTIHKAKGLEFPVVCVPELGQPLGKDLSGPVIVDFNDTDERMRVGLKIPGSDPKMFSWADIEDRADRETEAEELRLIHVAMTRAEEKMVLSARLKGRGNGKDQRVPAINRILEPFELETSEPATWAESIERSGRAEWLSVEVNLPDDADNVKRLVRRSPLVVQSKEIDAASPPLARPQRAFFPDVPLSFSSLVEFTGCPARFFARRVLRMELSDGRTDRGWTGPETTVLTERDRGSRFGTAVHELLERSALAGWQTPGAAEVESVLAADGLELDADLVRANGMIDGFLGSDLGNRAKADGARATPEVPIVLGIGGLTIRGFVDLLLEEDGVLTVLDYKTNRLDGKPPDEAMGPYDLQRDLYSLAVARARELEAIESAFVFLEDPDSPVLRTYGPEDLEAVEERLRSEVVNPIVGARYFGGGTGPQPCEECEACRLLGLSGA